MNQLVGIINFICYLFLSSFLSFGHSTVYTDQTYPCTSILIKSSGKHCGREKLKLSVQIKLWITCGFDHLFHSLPLNSMDNLVSKYQVTYDINIYLLFMIHFQEQLATVFASAGTLFLSPMGVRPSWQLPYYSVVFGAWGSDHTHLAELHNCTHKLAKKEQQLKRFWFGPKSLVISLHE